MVSITSPIEAPKAVTVERAAKLLSIGRSLAWNKIKDGTIRHIRLGNRVLVPMSVIDELLDPQSITT
jgi:excisionase family DNA binding protein